MTTSRGGLGSGSTGHFRRISWVVVCLAALGFAGSTAAPVAAAARSVASTQARRAGGHLTVVSVEPSGSWVGMDPFLSTISPGTAAMFPVWDPLFNLDPVTNGILTNSLATSYHVSGGGLTVTINLRKGVKFQDGTAFNSDAVVWNLERYQSSVVGSECASYLTVVASITASSPYQVTVQLNQRDAGFIPLLATQQCALMVSPTAYQAEGANFTNDPVGTGPFIYSSGEPGTVANFASFSGYWGGKPLLSSVTIEAVPSNDAAFSALKSGAAQAWLSLVDIGAVPQILEARADHNLKVSNGTSASITYVCFSFTNSPFDNRLAREAVTYATDSKVIDASLYHNLDKPIEGIFPPSSWAYDGGVEKGYPSYNLSKAQADVKAIHGLSFTLMVANTPSQLQLGEALQAQWQQAGITALLNPVPASSLAASLHAQSYQGMLLNAPGLPDPDNIAYRWFYSGSSFTQNGLKSDVVDKYIVQGRSDYGRAARKSSYLKLNQYLTSLDTWDDIASTSPYNIVDKNVMGLPVNPFSVFPWASVWVK